jgi:hypothetical protein
MIAKASDNLLGKVHVQLLRVGKFVKAVKFDI